MTARLPAAILALVAISLVLAACGRRPGQLDTPFPSRRHPSAIDPSSSIA
jgi:hypothetical protein